MGIGPDYSLTIRNDTMCIVVNNYHSPPFIVCLTIFIARVPTVIKCCIITFSFNFAVTMRAKYFLIRLFDITIICW